MKFKSNKDSEKNNIQINLTQTNNQQVNSKLIVGKQIFSFVLTIFLLLFLTSFVFAEEEPMVISAPVTTLIPISDIIIQNNVDIHIFVRSGCPHCAQLENYLHELKNDLPYINPIYHNFSVDPNALDLLESFSKKLGITVSSVPTTFIGDNYVIGYYPSKIRELIQEQYVNGVENNGSNQSIDFINLPFFGNINSNEISLPLITIILGFLDGFNPCAFFVLLFLLSMMVYARSKKRMLVIGLTFVFFSGLIYFLFMSAWLNFFMITKGITIITTIAGIIALIIAVINIKDFFAFKKGISLSVGEEQQKDLVSRMKNLLKAESMTSMMIGTITLAIAANMYELLCTAGFPMVFTKILVLNELNTMTYYAFLVLYNIVYVLPLLLIVIFFTHTFGAKKLSQEQGETLKLLSGMMMLSLGSMLVFNPSLLNNIFTAISIIILAIIVTGIIIIIKKKHDNKTKNTNITNKQNSENKSNNNKSSNNKLNNNKPNNNKSNNHSKKNKSSKLKKKGY